MYRAKTFDFAVTAVTALKNLSVYKALKGDGKFNFTVILPSLPSPI